MTDMSPQRSVDAPYTVAVNHDGIDDFLAGYRQAVLDHSPGNTEMAIGKERVARQIADRYIEIVPKDGDSS